MGDASARPGPERYRRSHRAAHVLVRSLAAAATALGLAGVGIVGAHAGAVGGHAPVSACNLAAQRDPGANVVTGATTGDDVLTGTRGPDIIDGAAGDDTIRGRGGGDVLCGGDGDDVFVASPGEDRVEGDAGADRVLAVDRGADGATRRAAARPPLAARDRPGSSLGAASLSSPCGGSGRRSRRRA